MKRAAREKILWPLVAVIAALVMAMVGVPAAASIPRDLPAWRELPAMEGHGKASPETASGCARFHLSEVAVWDESGWLMPRRPALPPSYTKTHVWGFELENLEYNPVDCRLSATLSIGYESSHDGLASGSGKARYYDPLAGRFLTEDPFEGTPDTPPSLHKYLYAFANPTVFVDPTGRVSEENGAGRKKDTEASRRRRARALRSGIRLRPGEQAPAGTVEVPGDMLTPRRAIPILDYQANGALGRDSSGGVVVIGEDEVQPRSVFSILTGGRFDNFSLGLRTPREQVDSLAKNLKEARESFQQADETLRTAPGRRPSFVDGIESDDNVQLSSTLDQGRVQVVPQVAEDVGSGVVSSARAAEDAADLGATLSVAGALGKGLLKKGLKAGVERGGVRFATPGAFEGVSKLSRILREAGVPRSARLEVINSFKNGQIVLKRATGNENVLRFFGGDARKLGRFVTEGFPQGDARTLLALPSENAATGLTQFKLREGAVIFEGSVGPNFGLPGGGRQIFVPNLDDLVPVQ